MARRRLTTEDLLQFTLVSDPHISPDGRQVVWVKTWMDTENNANRTQVQLTDLNTGATRPLVAGTGTTNPRWSPNGKYVALLAPAATPLAHPGPGPAVDIYGGSQITVVPAEGGDPWQLTEILTGAGVPVWSPEGDRIAFVTRVHPERGLELLGEPPIDPVADPLRYFNQDVLVVNRIKWKADGTGFLGDYRYHVACVSFAPEAWGRTPQPQVLTEGSFDLMAPTWSPDGRYLAVLGNTDPDNERVWDTFLYLIDTQADQPSEPKRLFGM